MLAAAPRLRWEVLAGLCGGRASLRCYVGWHGRHVPRPNPEDHTVVVVRCPPCGRLHDPRQHLPAHDADGVARGGVRRFPDVSLVGRSGRRPPGVSSTPRTNTG